MSQSEGIVTPSGKVVSNDAIDRMLDLNKRVKNEMAAKEKVAEVPWYRRIFSGWTADDEKVEEETPSIFYNANISSSGVNKPSKELTGVDPSLTGVCATISHQIYTAESKDSFKLSDSNHVVEVLYFHDHGDLKDTVPPLVIAVSGDTLILGWRGSQTLMDWLSDAAYAPVLSSRWSSITPNVRAHSAYSALVESDLALYEKTIIDEIKTRNISQLILTGHSLAGGMAHVAHLAIEGQLSQSGTAWSSLQGQLTCRTVAFSAPMTILNMDATRADTETNKFLQRVADHSCNIIFNCDAVPHAVGDIEFLDDIVDDVLPELVKGIPAPRVFTLMFGVEDKLDEAFDNFVGNNLKTTLPVLIKYHHIGSIIYYPDAKADPVLLRDSAFLPADVPEFRGYKVALPRDNKEVGAIKQLGDAHLFFPSGLAYNVDDK